MKKKAGILITAESLTGGLIGQRITSVAGASEVFWGGLIVYTAAAKEQLAGVNPAVITQYGVVSEETAVEMAKGAVNILPESGKLRCSIAVTGLAGPGGGTQSVPVGTVCIAAAVMNQSDFQLSCKKYFFTGDRAEIRNKTCDESMRMLWGLLDKKNEKRL